MFYILMIIGIAFIIAGVLLERQAINLSKDDFIDEVFSDNKRESSKINNKQALILENRIEILEEMLFTKVLKEELDKPVAVEEEEVKGEEDSVERYKLIMRYEEENKSLDEIAKLLGVNKGEVLLLKNLYKDL